MVGRWTRCGMVLVCSGLLAWSDLASAIDMGPASGGASVGRPAHVDEGLWESLSESIAATGQQATLVAPDGASDDRLGTSVALSGDTALVGAPRAMVGSNAGQGAVYVFVRTGASWTLQARLTGGIGATGDFFGTSVALSGDTALIGAPNKDVGSSVDQGVAYVFVRNGTSWTLQAELVAADGAAFDSFGWSVALSEDTALVSSRLDDVGTVPNQGSTYAYVRSGSTWSQQAKLVAADGQQNDDFGYSVALSGDTAVIGAPLKNINANMDAGAAYVFNRSGTVWTKESVLVALAGSGFDSFGYSVALSGDTLLVGAVNDDIGANQNQGSAHVFLRTGGSWSEWGMLVMADGVASEAFGSSVALSTDTAVIGARSDPVGPDTFRGSAVVFVRAGTEWTLQGRLLASDGASGDQLGSAVAVSGNTVLAGAPYADIAARIDQGAAYAFVTPWGLVFKDDFEP